MKYFVLIVTIMFLFLGCDESESKPDKDSDAVINNADSENDEDLQNEKDGEPDEIQVVDEDEISDEITDVEPDEDLIPECTDGEEKDEDGVISLCKNGFWKTLTENNIFVMDHNNNDEGSVLIESLFTDNSGNLLAAGTLGGILDGKESRSSDGLVIKYDSKLNMKWLFNYDSSTSSETRSDYINGVTSDKSGNVYITGFSNKETFLSSDDFDKNIFVVKISSEGAEIWRKEFGTELHDMGNAVAVDSNGNVFIAGYVGASFNGNEALGEKDLFIAKFDSSGTELWTKQIGDSFDDEAFAITVDSEDNFYVTGYIKNALCVRTINNGKYYCEDLFTAKFSNDGTEIWSKIFGNNYNSSIGKSIVLDKDMNIFISGVDSGSFAPTDASFGVVLMKLQNDGTELWTNYVTEKYYGKSGGVVSLDSTGNAYVAATVEADDDSGYGFMDTFLSKVKNDGTVLWTRQYEKKDDETISAIATGEDNIFVAGSMLSKEGGCLQLYFSEFSYE